MAQQIIDFGSFPNDPSADPIRAAFQKVQNNFTELYATSLSTGVIEITAEDGLSQNRSTGNVTLSANISNIRLYTGSTNSLVFGTTSTPTASSVVRFDSISPIYIDLAPNITTVNANFTGNLHTGNFTSSNLTVSSNATVGNMTVSGNAAAGNMTVTSNIAAGNITVSTSLGVANFSMSGYVTTSLVPAGNKVHDLGTATNRWRDLYLSGTTLQLGTVAIQSDGSSILMPSVTVSGNIAAGNVTAGVVSGNLATAVQPNITSVGTLAQLEVAGAIQANSMSISGSFSAATITGNVVVPPGGNVQAPGSNMQVLFNDSGNAAAVAGLMFDKANTLLTIQGDIAGSNLNVENANITGNIGVNKVVATGNVEGSNIVTLGVVSTQSGITTGANLAITSISGTGSFVTVNFATQTSIPFASGDTITISGVLPTTYNGTWTVATGTTSLITFASSLTTTATVTSARIKGNGNTTINGILNVVGNTSIGNITAVNSITGNTIVLSGNVDSGNLIASGIIRVTGTANLGAVFSPGDSNVQNSTVRGSFGATGAATFAGTITATADASFYANVLANSNMSVVGGLTASTANIANFRITTGGNVVGNIFTATLFSGNGANITFINGANVTGVVPQASSASTATIAQTAWAVAGANVSGTVASASYSTTAGSATSATTATTASAVAASGITGQTGMWTSTNRPGPYRLYRRDDDSNYSVQHHYTGSYWLLRGYNGDAYHAGCQVAYADSAGSATSAGSVPWSGVTGKPDTSSSIQYSSFGVGTAASGTAGEIRATNNITAYYSDDSLKTNLGTIENALDKIDQLTGFYYEENDLAVSLGYPRKRQVGLSAQTMKKVMPEIVTGAPIDPERFLTIWYEKTAPLLVEGIKELRREINKIKKHIDLE